MLNDMKNMEKDKYKNMFLSEELDESYNEYVKLSKLLTLRETNILAKLERNSRETDKFMNDVSKHILKITKIKNEVRQKRERFKLAKNTKKFLSTFEKSIQPSHNTLAIHALLDANLRLTGLVGYKSKVFDSIGEKITVTTKSLYKKSLFYDTILEGIKSVDTRISNLMIKHVNENDTVINRKNIINKIKDLKRNVEVHSSHEFQNKEMTDLNSQLCSLLKSIAIVQNCLKDSRTTLSKALVTQMKNNITRIKKNIIILELHMHEINVFLEADPKYAELIVKAFFGAPEVLREDNWKSYEDYLRWIDKKGKLQEEIDLIDLSWNEDLKSVG